MCKTRRKPFGQWGALAICYDDDIVDIQAKTLKQTHHPKVKKGESMILKRVLMLTSLCLALLSDYARMKERWLGKES